MDLNYGLTVSEAPKDVSFADPISNLESYYTHSGKTRSKANVRQDRENPCHCFNLFLYTSVLWFPMATPGIAHEFLLSKTKAMGMNLRVPSHIEALVPYPPGKPLEELEREYGIVDSIKLASNENPLGPSPKAVAAMQGALTRLHRYPDGSGYYLRRKLSEKYGLPFDGIVLGNGSNEIIELVIRAFVLPGDEVILPAPSFLVYGLAVQTVGARGISVPLQGFHLDLKAMAAAVTERTRVVFVNNPNNPTGTVVRRQELATFLAGLPSDVIVVLDEAYIEFVRDPECPNGFDVVRSSASPVVVLRTFSKAYGLAGVRIGYGVMPAQVADYLNRVRQPFNTTALSQAAALAALDDDEFLAKTRETVWSGLVFLYEELKRLQLPYVSTETNFVLIEVPREARLVYEAMLHRGVIIRSMASYGLKNHVRINVGLPEENRRCMQVLEQVLVEMGGVRTFAADTTAALR
jgi:histidinol-phosphate aminotransferase